MGAIPPLRCVLHCTVLDCSVQLGRCTVLHRFCSSPIVPVPGGTAMRCSPGSVKSPRVLREVLRQLELAEDDERLPSLHELATAALAGSDDRAARSKR